LQFEIHNFVVSKALTAKGSATAVMVYETEVDVALCSTDVARACYLRIADFTIFGAENL
jgi:hypothetical protein